MKKETSKYKKGVIIAGIIVALILLIFITADGIKNMNSKISNLALSEQEMVTPPNAPVLSSGMIPVKYNGDDLIICKNDSDWYDYENGTPAYMMLNDGVYQSEVATDMREKKLASENIDEPVEPEEQGSIYMWIPRFEINEENKTKYVQNVDYAREGYEIPEMFIHRQAAETSPDYLLTGVWVEKTPLDSAVTTKVANMTGENNTYGFIANTMAVSMTAQDRTAIENYIANTVGVDEGIDPITDLTNTNRTIIHILNPQNRDIMKAKSNYNKSTGIITVQVTYTEYGIDKIMLEDKELTVEKGDKKATANTQGIMLEEGTYIITIIDNNGNKKELETQVVTGIYAVLYEDGTLVFGKSNPPILEAEKKVSVSYGDISDLTDRDYIDNGTPWKKEIEDITTVEFVKEIMPRSTYRWFEGCSNLTEIKNTENLNTRNITDMSNMFYECSSLTSLDLSGFDTRKVTDMKDIFYECSSLTEISFGKNWKGTVTLPTFDKPYDGWYDKSSGEKVADKGKKVTYTPNGEITIYANVTQPIYVKLYNDGTLAFNTNNTKMEGKILKEDYDDISGKTIGFLEDNAANVEKVVILDKIAPTSIRRWFFECSNLTEIENIENLDTSKVTDMREAFSYCRSLTSLDLSGFDTKNVTSASGIFTACSNLSEITFGENWKVAVDLPALARPYDAWYDSDTDKQVAEKRATYTPNGAITIYANVTQPIYAKLYNSGKLLVLSSKDVNYEEKKPYEDYGDISKEKFLDTDTGPNIERVVILDKIVPTSTAFWFQYCSNLTEIENIENIDTRRVTSMRYMFRECSSLTSLDLSSFNTKNVTDMSRMFYKCSSLTSLDLSNFNTKNVTEMEGMFYRCNNLETIYVGDNWNLNRSELNCSTATNIIKK